MEELVIEPGRSEQRYWRDVWRYRELLYFLVWRDILVRYKQTVLGVAWAIIQPLLTMGVFTIVFSRIAKLPSDGAPYPILVFAALLPWQFASQAVSAGSNSLIGNTNLISKLYFPRIIVPVSTVMTSLVDLAISALFLAILMLGFGFAPSWRIVMLPFFLLLMLGASMGAAIGLAALNVRYRDFRYIVPFLIQAGLYISPVGFSSSVVPSKWRLLYAINPMVGIIDGFRWAIIGTNSRFLLAEVILAIGTTAVIVSLAIVYFRSTEKTFADII